ncbi:MAG: MFS transporter [Actinobacteria bacterium]|nr:MFS transporter [Actinomycetota bacterium]
MTTKPKAPGSLKDLPPAIWILAIIAFCVALGFGIVAPAIPLFARSFGVTAFAASTVVSIFAFTRLISSPISGLLIEKIGERVVLTAGLVIVAITTGAAGAADEFTQLLVLRGLSGFGSAMFTISAMSLVVRLAPRELRARANSLFQGGFLTGILFGPALGAAVLAISVRAPFYVYGFTVAIAAIIAAIFLSTARTQAPTDVEPTKANGPNLRLVDGFRHAGYRAAFTVSFTVGFTIFGLRAAAVPLYVTEELMAAASLVAFGFFAGSVTQITILLPAGKYADTRGRREAMVIGSVLAVISSVLLTVWQSPTGYLISMGMGGFAGAFLSSTPAAIVGDVVEGRRRGPLLAAFQMAADVGGIIGPLIAGLVIDGYGFTATFAMGIVATVIALIVTLMMPKKHKPPIVAQ